MHGTPRLTPEILLRAYAEGLFPMAERRGDPTLDWYRRSAEGGYFRGAFNYATLLAETGRKDEAETWFDRAIATAPEPTRGRMIALRGGVS